MWDARHGGIDMKLINYLQIMGFKRQPQHYGYEVIRYEIDEVGTVQYAQWQHPIESTKVIDTKLVAAYQAYISAGDFCIDIGAHSGDTTLPMGLAAGPTGCVLALEPNPYVFPVLQKTARANAQVANIKPLLAAAGATEGFMTFEYSDAGFCNGGRHENISMLQHGHPFKQTVFAVNLEHELRADFATWLPRLRFVKVDAEGYDLYVLQSLAAIIREFRPVIKAEVFKKTDRAYREGLLQFFAAQGYDVFKINAEPLGKGELLGVKNLDLGQHYDILALPRTIAGDK